LFSDKWWNSELNTDDKKSEGMDWLEAELEDTLDEDYELEMSEPAFSIELHKIYKKKHPKTLDRDTYFRALIELQAELIKLLDWVEYTSEKIAVIFDERDSAGKGGVIERITQRLNPCICRVVALTKPSEKERTQWFFSATYPTFHLAGR
jgi:polyphosphate kinase 2 (PPK2 family)